MPKIDANKLTLEERVVEVNRVSKVVSGGRRFNYSAVVVVGDKNGIVGAGSGKANEVPDAIRKAVDDAKKHLVQVTIIDGTIPHPIVSEYGAATVLLRPAAPGTGVIAGGPVRAVVESAGIRDILSKSVGSSSKRNTVAATMKALTDLQDVASVAQKRHMTVEQLVGNRQRS